MKKRVGLFTRKSPTFQPFFNIESITPFGGIKFEKHVSILLVTLVIDDTGCNRLDAEQVRVVDVVAQVVATVGAATEGQ